MNYTRKYLKDKKLKEAKNSDVIENFLTNGNINVNTKNLRMFKDKSGINLLNYATIIAKNESGKIYLNTTKYSVTTSIIQNLVKRVAESYNLDIIEVSETFFTE